MESKEIDIFVPGRARWLLCTLTTAHGVVVIVCLFLKINNQWPRVPCNESRIPTLDSLHLKGEGLGKWRNLERLVPGSPWFLITSMWLRADFCVFRYKMGMKISTLYFSQSLWSCFIIYLIYYIYYIFIYMPISENIPPSLGKYQGLSMSLSPQSRAHVLDVTP